MDSTKGLIIIIIILLICFKKGKAMMKVWEVTNEKVICPGL